MRNLLRVLPVLLVAGLVTGLQAPVMGRKGAPAQAEGPKVNACGCYRDVAGMCYCGKKGKCDCPGECEPQGCEERRAKELEKEVAAETKRAREAEKKQREREAEQKKKAEAVNDEEEVAARAREQAAENPDGGAENPEATSKAKNGKAGKDTKKAKDGKKAKNEKSQEKGEEKSQKDEKDDDRAKP
jgi:hypothetical protein